MPSKCSTGMEKRRDHAAAAFVRRGRGRAASDWRRAVAAVSERRVAQGRALYTERSPAELYRGARSSERERYARPRGPRKFALANFWGEPASRLGAERPFPAPAQRGAFRRLLRPHAPRNDSLEDCAACWRPFNLFGGPS